MNSTKIKRKGRTLALTVNELIESPRFRIAMEMFKTDPMLMKAILIELGMEAQNVAKYKIISEVMTHQGLDRFELKPYLSQVSDFTKYNIYWGMSDIEKLYYSKNPKGELSPEESVALFKKIKKQFGML